MFSNNDKNTFIFSERHFHLLKQGNETKKANLMQCNKCFKDFRQKKSLEGHLRTCIGSGNDQVKPFACDFCDYRAKLKHHLRLHIDNVHLRLQPKPQTADYPCPKCNRRYFHKKSMLSHLRHDCSKNLVF